MMMMIKVKPPTDDRVKLKECKSREQISRPCRRTKTTIEHGGDGDASCNWST